MPEVIPIGCGTVNGYLLRGEAGCVLVDSGGPGDGEKLPGKLGQAGLGPDGPGLLLLTHAHPDHSGGAEALRQRWGTPLALHPADAEGESVLQKRGAMGSMIMLMSGALMREQKPIKADIPLEEGLRLDAWGVGATVLHLPGHTAGSVAVLTDDGNLIAGDMYMHFTVPHLAYIAEDFEALENSHERLAGMGIKTVYPGHGAPFDFGAPAR